MNFKQEIDELKYAVAELQERVRIHIGYDIKPTYPIKAPDDVAIGYHALKNAGCGIPPEKKLKSLKEHNAEGLKKWVNEAVPRGRNGIACPECGEELHDSDDFCTLISNPPQIPVKCPKCGWTGSRY
jgi:predicted RNA-binding Zn-ribbon protein involved in translation (DUF1610 family)